MKKRIFIIFVIILIFGIGIYYFLSNDNNSSDEIPEGYMAIFHGGVGEIMYRTYIYKINNGQANYGFKYINVVSHTEKWGSANWVDKITEKGKVDWTDDVFGVAKKNNAYSFVTLPGDTKAYKIDEFMKIFLMN